MDQNELSEVIRAVERIQGRDDSGHGCDHVIRVCQLADSFCLKQEQADREIVRMIAWLHDVDDYKLTGKDDGNLNNAKEILDSTALTFERKQLVLNGISTIGYSKRLAGIRPQSLEAAIVSDADMCDASGITGILRAYQYSRKSDRPFFDRDIWPMDKIDLGFYKSDQTTTVNHLFEKILRLKDLMLTDAGKQEALRRHQAVYRFLEEYFREQRADEWLSYLEKYR